RPRFPAEPGAERRRARATGSGGVQRSRTFNRSQPAERASTGRAPGVSRSARLRTGTAGPSLATAVTESPPSLARRRAVGIRIRRGWERIQAEEALRRRRASSGADRREGRPIGNRERRVIERRLLVAHAVVGERDQERHQRVLVGLGEAERLDVATGELL